MLKQEKLKIIEKLSDDLGLYFHDIDVTDETVIADSHFMKFVFLPNHVSVLDSYVLPGTEMQNFINLNLPYKLEYTRENFLNIFMEDIDSIHSKLVSLEILEEESQT